MNLRNKKGDVSDGIIIVVTLFFLAIAFIAVAFINDKFSWVIRNTVLNETSVADQIADSVDLITTKTIQQGYAMIFAFLCIGTLLSSFLVRVHPAFFFMYILFGGFMVILGVVLANAYSAFINNDTLATIASQQTMITWIMTHVVKIMIGVIALSVVVLMAKQPESGGVV
jgi:hypothetical protein